MVCSSSQSYNTEVVIKCKTVQETTEQIASILIYNSRGHFCTKMERFDIIIEEIADNPRHSSCH